jgi:hypothetical protein
VKGTTDLRIVIKGEIASVALLTTSCSIGAIQMDPPIAKLSKLEIVRGELDYHITRAAVVIIFFVFGCQK